MRIGLSGRIGLMVVVFALGGCGAFIKSVWDQSTKELQVLGSAEICDGWRMVTSSIDRGDLSSSDGTYLSMALAYPAPEGLAADAKLWASYLGDGGHASQQEREELSAAAGRLSAGCQFAPSREDAVAYVFRNFAGGGPGTGPSGMWKNCTEAKNAGATPVYRSDPGFGTHLDRGNNGIGCQNY